MTCPLAAKVIRLGSWGWVGHTPDHTAIDNEVEIDHPLGSARLSALENRGRSDCKSLATAPSLGLKFDELRLCAACCRSSRCVQRQEVAEWSHPEPRRDGPLGDTLQTLGSRPTQRDRHWRRTSSSALSTSCPRRTVMGMQTGWRMPIGIGDGFESKSLASTNRNQRRSSSEYAVGARLVVSAPDGRRDRCDVADVE